MARTSQATEGLENGDVLVIFGITGDLAKVMTFRSLYRLEARGLLTGPIVGVAVDDWTVDQLVERARESIVGTGEKLNKKVFDRLAARFAYVQGDFTDAAMYKRVGKAIKGKTAALAWGTVHLALLSTGEDRAKAIADWTWAGFSHERPGRITVQTDEE